MHLSAFVTVKVLDTPDQQLFHSIATTAIPDEQHKIWYKEIRTIISDRITNEEPFAHSTVAPLATLVLGMPNVEEFMHRASVQRSFPARTERMGT